MIRFIMCIFSLKAFVAAKTMGARLGRWDIEGDPPMGSPTNAVVGLFMLWWGWFAFNAGSTFGNFVANTVLSNISHSLYIISGKSN